MISPVPPSLDLAAILLGDDDDSTPFADEDLIPARMLNEFTYCPRLAYLEWVQGEFTDNLDTRQGTFGHRNVDKASARPVAAAASRPNPSAIEDTPESETQQITTRALTLSAPREGLVAKLDVLELEGSVVTPIDYKKGSIPDNPEQSWEPERVQLCAQGLILRENGYTCEHGELYYIESRRRVVIHFDDALVMRTRELVKRLREMANSERMPPPLVDSPKCPRCSLVGICLPDETNLLLRETAETAAHNFSSQRIPQQRVEQELFDPSLSSVNRDRASDLSDERRVASGENHQIATNRDRANDIPIRNPSRDAHEPAVPAAVRRLLPARDDALPLYVKEQGAFVGKDGDRLVVRHREAKLISVPLIEVSQVSLFGNVQMSAQVLREIVDRGIPVCHFSYGGWFHAMTTGHVQKNIELRIAQFATAADPAKSLALAKGFITAKIKNSRTMLRRHGIGHVVEAASLQSIGTRNVAGTLRVPSAKDEQDTVETDDTQENPSPDRQGVDAFCQDTGRASGTQEDTGRDGGLQENTGRAGGTHQRDLDQLAEWVQKAERATSAEALLGLEGMAAKVYFAGFSRILKGGDAFNMNGRNRRPPRDPVNAILSFVYSLLAKELTIAVQAVGFDPLLGFFHKPRYGRPSLALDLAEEFRPIIADSTAMMLINNGEVSESSFLARAGAVALTEPGRRAVIAAFERRLEQEITHPIFGYKISYRRVLEVQARLLSRVVLGELAEYPGFCTR